MQLKERTSDRLIALFFLGVLLFSPLPLEIFDAGASRAVFGVPVLVIYVFAAWGLLIALIALIARTLTDEEAPPSEHPGAHRLGD